MFKTKLTIGLVAAALSTNAVAQSQSVTVSYGDLDLTTSAGIAAFDSRIDAAVERVCGQPSMLSQRNAVSNCRAAARAQAQSQRSVLLARAQAGKNGTLIASSR